MTPNLLRQAAMLLNDMLNFDKPADAKMSEFFRNNRDLGNKERAFIAESVYGVIRRFRFLSTLTANDENDPDDARKLILAWLLRVQGRSLRDLDDMLTEQQKEWAIAIKAKSTEDFPIAVQADVRDWLWEKLVSQYGEEQALTICRSMFDQATLDLRVNTIKGTPEEVLAKMIAENINNENIIAAMPYSPIGIRMPNRVGISKHVLFTEGKIEVQDEGSQILSYLVAPKRGQMVADLCAGAGGKTLALGALMRNTGRLYAFDVSEKRLNNLGKRLKRSGLSNLNAQVINNENDLKLKRLNAKFDRVLVDAPCSGLGTLRRNPDLKWRQTEQDVIELNQKQTNILARAAKLVKAGGRVVYATCSLLKEENEVIAEAFLSAHPEFVLIPANEVLAQQQINLDTGKYLNLLPHLHGTDGFFAAVFEKKLAEDKPTVKPLKKAA
ncbi:MAG: RsmB/NOP family class I SAM-dependent RNA methyltransferase [Methylophilaceae bacterium]|jgi:16S rRNA (cytosine967-C5)-methyltransferase|nr:RsmB/NOP family class I SAM-dependent RNA methyltransferase [Methylophilaceae bacterium]MDG1454408.1 RsmB/NOP family class I SAM-dependent RNA methyltransferase [Methylophilaceae bacterium]